MELTTLSRNVGTMMRPVPRIWLSSSMSSAAAEIRDSGLPAVAVTDGYLYVAMVSQRSLAEALAEGAQPSDSVQKAFDSRIQPLPPYAPGERALEAFATLNLDALPVVDDQGALMGIITPADLLPKRDRPPNPGPVGGMATPFGVYLTNGSIRAGAKDFALVTTGMIMFTALTLGMFVASWTQELTYKTVHIPDFLFGLLAYLLFMGAFRAFPLSGIHAAEHKVVHAIERGEELTIANVRRMPRVHPRCGTNFAVGASLFFGLATARWLINDEYIRLMTALLSTLIFWRPLGGMVQFWVTTKEPTDKQISMGILSGEELLQSYREGKSRRSGVLRRIWTSGMLHVMGGAFIMYGLFYLIATAFPGLHIPLD
jgi:CBS domain-containing protein